MLNNMQGPALRIADILVGASANHQLALVRLAHIGMHRVRHDDTREHRLNRLRHQRLQRIAFQRKIQPRHLHHHRSIARRRNAHALAGNAPARRFNAFDSAIAATPDRCHRAILDNIDAQSRRRPRIAPGDRIMPRRAAAPLQRRAQHRMPRLWRDAQRRAVFLSLLRRQPFIIDAVQPVGMNMPLETLHIMHIMRQHHHAALGIHGVVIQLLAQPIPQLDRVIVQMRAFVIEIVGADDGGVAPGIAAADPAFLQDRDVGDPVFFRQIIGRAQPMPAAAYDDRVISGFRRSIGPLLGPALVPAQGLGKEGKSAETGHGRASTKGA